MPNRHPLDLSRHYVEPAANPKPAPEEAHTAQAHPAQ